MDQTEYNLPLLGWREWLAIPDLGIDHIKAKIDTGARTSALHACFVEAFRKSGKEWVRFGIHPWQRNTSVMIECESLVKDRRVVTDSGGHKEYRYVIETNLVLGELSWLAEMTLTDRDSMQFRMLLGRTALDGRFIIDPSGSYLLGKKPLKHKTGRKAKTSRAE